MSNPLRRSARRAQSGLRSKAGDVEKFGSSRGWDLVVGSSGDVAVSFKELVEEGYRKNPVAAACLRKITNAVTNAPLRAFRKNGESLEKLDSSHPAQEPVRRPNRRDTHIDLIERGIQHYFLGGNVFWLKSRDDDGRPVDIHTRRPDQISKVIADEEDIPLGYSFHDEEAGGDLLLARDVVHIRDVDPWLKVLGKPRLLSSSLEIRTDNEASEYVSEVLNNHGQPGMVVGVKQATNREQLERAEEMWQEKFGPNRGRGKVGFVPGATSINQIGFNLRELEFPDLRMITRESICAALGVDPMLVGVGSASQDGSLSGGEHEEAQKRLWTDTVIPMFKRWQAALNQFLAPDFDESIRYKFDLSGVESLNEGRNDQIERAVSMAEAGAFTLEEIRSEVDGVEPLPDEDAIIVTDMRTVLQGADSVMNGEEEEQEQVPGGEEEAQALSDFDQELLPGT